METLKVVFEIYDKNKSGYIEVIELQEIISNLGKDPKDCMIIYAHTNL